MFAIVDCNNFYASCERLFQPQLEHRPIVVLSNNDGCVIARSNEAKALGIKMGAPAFEIQTLLEQHQVAVFSSNYALYGDLSHRVMQVLGRFTPAIEIYSIDEAFLDVAQFAFADLSNYGSTIRAAVLQQVGIPTTIGMATSKTLAKAANRYAKKACKTTGVFVIDSEAKRQEVLEALPVEDVWGIGRKYQIWLAAHNIKTAWQLSNANLAWIQKKMGVVGLRLVKELQGIACYDLEEQPAAKQGIMTSRSFGHLISEKKLLQEAIATHATRCAEKLRKQDSCCALIQVFIHTNAYRKQDAQYHGVLSIPIPAATDSTSELIQLAMSALDHIYKPGFLYKKAGVYVSEIVPRSQVQLSLFSSKDRGKEKQLHDAMDKINTLMGRDKVRYAAAGISRKWKLRQEKKSPCYTTNVNELLRIKN